MELALERALAGSLRHQPLPRPTRDHIELIGLITAGPSGKEATSISTGAIFRRLVSRPRFDGPRRRLWTVAVPANSTIQPLRGIGKGESTITEQTRGVVILASAPLAALAWVRTPEYQNLWSIPACFITAFAVCRERHPISTLNERLLIGLYHSSWSPLACRLKKHPLRNRTSTINL